MLKYLGVKNLENELNYVFENEKFKIYYNDNSSKEIAVSTLEDILNNKFYSKENVYKGLFRKDSEKIIYFYNIEGNDCEDVMKLLNANKRISTNYKIYIVLYFEDGDSLYEIYKDKYWKIFDFIKINSKVESYINLFECSKSEEKGLRVFVTI